MRKFDMGLCETLKTSDAVRRTEINGVNYGLYIIERGERLFFQKGDLSLLCEISARDAILDARSVKQWDNGTKIFGHVKENLLLELIFVYKLLYFDDLSVVNINN